MADVTLAELNGNVWCVGGEDHLDDLLANTLAKDVTIELVPCESKSQVLELWTQNYGVREGYRDPWMVHPAIVARIRRSTPDYAVFFTQWSVMPDADALTVIGSAAAWARQNPEAPVLLAEYVDSDGPPAIEGLSSLRSKIIEDKLIEAGIAPPRIQRERRSTTSVPGMGQESQRVDIVIRVG